jgi:hypothetical protein
MKWFFQALKNFIIHKYFTELQLLKYMKLAIQDSLVLKSNQKLITYEINHLPLKKNKEVHH